ncbi:MAG TPA: 50S ribosomal protein L30 [Vicinamibacteria bacterium]|nr:50S ribosomal protein L30 [Vicinamibacteria bacterium]
MAESSKKSSGRKPKATTKKASGKKTASQATRAPAKPAKSAKPAKPAKPANLVAPGESVAPTAKALAGAASHSPKPSGAIRIQLVRSLIGSTLHQRAVVAGLGLRRLNQTVERKDTREIRGMVAKVPHLVHILS